MSRTVSDGGRRCAVYARYSTDRQNPASVDDQIHLCIGRIRELGGEAVATYADRGITGEFAILRPALQRLLRDALDGRFDVVVAEALDRISRSQADTAAIHRRLEFRGVRIHTLSEGCVGALHIGLRGTMNELFLADLRAKVRRGMEGGLRRGRIGGRIPYGFRSANRIGPDGRPELGRRRIEPAEAEVVRRIFRAYADGQGLVRICDELNAGAVAAPGRARQWRPEHLKGPVRLGGGILHNELYRGIYRYGRISKARDPDTGRLRKTFNGFDGCHVHRVPDLAILDDALWARAAARSARERRPRTAPHGDGWHLALPLTGLVLCGECGRPMRVAERGQYRCRLPRGRRPDDCGMNRRAAGGRIALAAVEAVLARAGTDDGWAAVAARQERERLRRHRELTARLRELDTWIDAVVDALRAGARGNGAAGRTGERLDALEAERAGAAAELADWEDFGAISAAAAAAALRERLRGMRARIAADPQAAASGRGGDCHELRGLVSRILVFADPDSRGTVLRVEPDDAALVEYACRLAGAERSGRGPVGTTERRAA